MQPGARHVSLNGVKAFEAAARLRSLKTAAAELGVSASAVSHQVRQLEATIGAKLFARRHNAIELTAEGAMFFADVSPAIDTINRAHQAVSRDATMITVKASQSLALCWLIPRLHDFQAQHRRIRVTVETTNPPASLAPGIDIALPYVRFQEVPPDGTLLFTDWSLPVWAPSLAKVPPPSTSPRSLPVALIGATADDWEWKQYAQETGLDPGKMRFVARFDTDQAALEACLSGLGVSLLPRAFIERELASGALVPLEQYPPVQQGQYWILAAYPRRPAADLFVQWLQRQAAMMLRQEPGNRQVSGRRPAGRRS